MVFHLVAAKDHAGESESVNNLEGRPTVLEPQCRGLEEADVEARVVGNEHGCTRELEKRGDDGFGRGRLSHHVIGNTGQRGDIRGDRTFGVDEGLKFFDDLAAHHTNGADFRDRVEFGVRPGGFEVDDDELDID